MAPQKARNDPNMLEIPKIFDFYHEIIRLKFLYRGSTKDLIQIVLSKYMINQIMSNVRIVNLPLSSLTY